MTLTTATPASSMPAVGTRRGGHLLPLDGLRGIAILAVMLSHLFAVNYEGHGTVFNVIGGILYWGQVGVDLFFVLSGFLITGILLDASGAPGFFRNFYMRRVLRIFPLYYGALLLLAALTPLLGIQWHGIFVPMALYLGNMQRFQALAQVMGGGVALNHFWSLAVEEQFYLIWPFLVFLARTRRSVLLLSLCGVLFALCFRTVSVAVWHNTFLPHFSTLGRADTLLSGACLAVLYRSRWWPAVLRLSRPAFLAAAAFLGLSYVFQNRAIFQTQFWTDDLRYSVLALAASSLLAWTLQRSLIATLCTTPVLRFFGRYSYGLYVLHMLFLPGLSALFRSAIVKATGSKLAGVVVSAGIILLLSVASAWLSFRFFEAPFLKLKRYFEYRAAPLLGSAPTS